MISLAYLVLPTMARYNTYYNYSYMDYFALPLHLVFFILILFLFLGFSWYINYESMFEDFMSQVKFYLLLCPVVLLLLVQFLSSDNKHRVPFYLSPEKEALHRAGGSPYGVALVLIFLIYMVSYQSSLQERWFPLLARWWHYICTGWVLLALGVSEKRLRWIIDLLCVYYVIKCYFWVWGLWVFCVQDLPPNE